MKKKKKHTLQAMLMLISFLTLCVVAYLAYSEFKPMVVKAVTMEAGAPMVDVKDFLLEDKYNGRYITDINNLDLNEPGIYEIRIKVRNRILTSNLEVVDSTPPVGEAVGVMALKGEEVQATAFVTNVSDATTVQAEFVSKPDTNIPGEQEVTIRLKDSSNNISELTAMLTVLDVKSSIQVEAGSEMDITPEDFLDNDNYDISFVTDIKSLDISKPATHQIQILVDGRTLNSNIETVDTTPPSAASVNQTIWKDETIEPISFVKEVKDVSGVQFTYLNQPDYSKLGDQEVTIVMTDTYGNRSELQAVLTVKDDIQPPVFSGVRDKTVYEGEGVAYKKGVSVTDNRDKDVKFQVDSSQVNLSEPGVYEVKYSATDSAGNKANMTSTVTVLEFVISDDMLNQVADEILADIVNDTMTKKEKAWAIYEYVRGHIAYTGESDKSDWKKEAYRGVKNAVGDCFTYFSVAKMLLTRVGIDNMDVTRVGGRTRHYWHLINCGDGWYHFDACPNKDKMQSFMLTDQQIADYTAKRGNNYYTFDKSLYPATPDK